jgi:hypothetical protein
MSRTPILLTSLRAVSLTSLVAVHANTRRRTKESLAALERIAGVLRDTSLPPDAAWTLLARTISDGDVDLGYGDACRDVLGHRPNTKGEYVPMSTSSSARS